MNNAARLRYMALKFVDAQFCRRADIYIPERSTATRQRRNQTIYEHSHCHAAACCEQIMAVLEPGLVDNLPHWSLQDPAATF